MKGMTKDKALKIIFDCAEQYRENLENKDFIFLFGNKNSIALIETKFSDVNFLHLTGVKSNGFKKKSTLFYRACLNKRLNTSEFELSYDGTTEMKLSVLPQIMEFYKTAKMMGDFTHSKPRLYTEKLVGNVTACLGFIREDKFYVPNTVLKEDIRDITKKPTQKILAIFSKNKKDKLYNNLCYVAKNVTLKMPGLQEIISQKVDMENLTIPANLQAKIAKTEELELKKFHPVLDIKSEPTVTVNKSETDLLKIGEPNKLYQAVKLFDNVHNKLKDTELPSKVEFTIDYFSDGKAQTYTGITDMKTLDDGLICEISNPNLNVLIAAHFTVSETMHRLKNSLSDEKIKAMDVDEQTYLKILDEYIQNSRTVLNTDLKHYDFPAPPKPENFLKSVENTVENVTDDKNLDAVTSESMPDSETEKPENYMKTTEEKIEGNANMIDGVVNNLPQDSAQNTTDVQPETSKNSELTEQDFYYGTGKMFGIYQLKVEDAFKDFQRKSYDFLTQNKVLVNIQNYNLVHLAEVSKEIPLDLNLVNDIRKTFSMDTPKNFKGHTVGLGDIIVLKEEASMVSIFIDKHGYKKLGDFFDDTRQPEHDALTENSSSPKQKSETEKQQEYKEYLTNYLKARLCSKLIVTIYRYTM